MQDSLKTLFIELLVIAVLFGTVGYAMHTEQQAQEITLSVKEAPHAISI